MSGRKVAAAHDPRWLNLSIEFVEPLPEDYGQRETFWPEDGTFGHLYVLKVSGDWIKVGMSRRWSRRQGDLGRQLAERHELTIVAPPWRTPPLPLDQLKAVEQQVLQYARGLADDTRYYYQRGDWESEEREMFHGTDYEAVCAYADRISSEA